MRILSIVLLSLFLFSIAGPGFAQTTNPYDVSWSALDPGNDWAAQVLRSIFPIPGGTPGTSTGNEATVIGQIVGQFTGFVAAIAAAFVSYISNGGYTTWRYSLSTGNESGNPVCGTVTVREKPQNEQTVAGDSVDMATVQRAILSDVSTARSAAKWQAWRRTSGETSKPRPLSRC